MQNRRNIDLLFTTLLIIGGLNWGLIGLFNINLVDALFGVNSIVSKIIYILVGLSALYTALNLASSPRIDTNISGRG